LRSGKFEDNKMGNTVIPPMTHPLGSHWRQPSLAEIELDSSHALMSEKTFQELSEYSCSMPTGIYEGKMWKRIEKQSFLMWYGQSEKEGHCSINHREIIIV
jgi:hypothetical protein